MLEIVTLNAIDRRAGIGTMLIEAAVGKARRFGCREIRLTTTNDNIDALRFYQRRGFRMAELRPGAVDQSRQEKPQIPRVGDYGIPLHDEIDLTRPVYLTLPRSWSTAAAAALHLRGSVQTPVMRSGVSASTPMSASGSASRVITSAS